MSWQENIHRSGCGSVPVVMHSLDMIADREATLGLLYIPYLHGADLPQVRHMGSKAWPPVRTSHPHNPHVLSRAQVSRSVSAEPNDRIGVGHGHDVNHTALLNDAVCACLQLLTKFGRREKSSAPGEVDRC